jgi:hypothetical protein
MTPLLFRDSPDILFKRPFWSVKYRNMFHVERYVMKRYDTIRYR